MDLASGIAGLTSLALELTTITYHYIRDVRNAPEESKQLHEELSALKTNLEELQSFLRTHGAQQIPFTFTKTSALVVSTGLCRNDLNYLKSKLVDFKKVYEKNKWYRRLAWPFQREEHTQVLRRIKDYIQTFHFSVSLEGCQAPDYSSLLAKTSQEIDEIHKQQRHSSRDISEISNIVARLGTTIKFSIDHQFEEIRKSLGNHERKQLLDWLSEVDPSRNHNAATETKEPETGEWFIKSEAFTEWVESSGLIWLYGIPGCGKTVLCSSIIECVQDLCRSSDGCKSAYFYFSFQAAAEQNLNVVLGSLLRQLSAKETRVPSAAQKLYDMHYTIGHRPSTKDLKEALVDIIKELSSEVYIMLDALDEVLDKKERGKILEHFATLASLRLGNLHFLATSRDEWDIRKSLWSLSGGGTPIQRCEVDADIRKYVGSCLRDWIEVPQQMKPLIQDKIGAKAHGMFRWAACQIETIQDCRTVTEIEKALNDLPETLDDTYERVLQNIWRMDAEKGRAIFTWLLFSEWPLTLHELAEAAVLKPGDTKLNPGDRLTHFSGVLSICRSLIVVSDTMDGLSGSIYEGHDVQLIRFAHFSVKEYLTSGRSKVFTGRPVPSHEYIGNCCISMLLSIDHLRLQEKMDDLWMDQYLLHYAAGSWFFHIKQLEALGKVSEELSSGVGKLLDRGPSTESHHAWTQIYDPVGNQLIPRHSRRIDSSLWHLPPLFSACLLGLMGEVHRCIKAGNDVNQYVPDWGTPLHVASMQDNHKVTEILLHCGADAKIRDHNKRTAFGRAARDGNEENLRILFDHGIDFNSELEDAIRAYDLETVRFLLEHGASSNRALQSAVHREHPDIVEFIVENSADLDAENTTRALFVAARSGREKTFELLIERGASIRATAADGLDLLLAAVHGGSLGIISKIVKSGVDINAPGCVSITTMWGDVFHFYTTPLQYAAQNGDHNTIKHLLNHGAEVNRPGFSFGTELQAAIGWHGRISFPLRDNLPLLLEHGADVNQQTQTRSIEIPSTPSRKKGTVLQQAVAKGLDSVAQFLVDKGADIDAQHNHCGTALMCASRQSVPMTLRVLIDMNADVNAQVAGLGSALSDAAKWGRCDNVQFLLENGADVDAEVDGVGTALLTALLHGQFQTAAVLIEAGADLPAAIQDMSSFFSIASEHDGREIMKLCFASYHPYPEPESLGAFPKLESWDTWDLAEQRYEREQKSGRGRILRSCI